MSRPSWPESWLPPLDPPPPLEFDEQGALIKFRALPWQWAERCERTPWALMVVQQAYFGDDLWVLPRNWCLVQI